MRPSEGAQEIAHLTGFRLPSRKLASTAGDTVDLSVRPARFTVVYCYPRTSSPLVATPANWGEIPGAKGCTPQTCSFRDNHRKFLDIGAEVFGLSSQDSEYQREMVARLHVPYEILSDADFSFSDAVRLPTFEVDGIRLLRRITLVISGGRIVKPFYPVADPELNADDVLRWLGGQAAGSGSL